MPLLLLDEPEAPAPLEPELPEPVEPVPEAAEPSPPARQSFGNWPRLLYIDGSQRFGSVAETSFFFVPACEVLVPSLLPYVLPLVEVEPLSEDEVPAVAPVEP